MLSTYGFAVLPEFAPLSPTSIFGRGLAAVVRSRESPIPSKVVRRLKILRGLVVEV